MVQGKYLRLRLFLMPKLLGKWNVQIFMILFNIILRLKSNSYVKYYDWNLILSVVFNNLY